MKITIKSAISKILYDNRLDPAEFRVIFKHQDGEYWDVPFNYLRFQGGFFQYSNLDTLYPLHRIVAIYSLDGGYLVRRKFNPDLVVIKPQTIEITPGIPIEQQYDSFTVARFGWLIIRHLESMLSDKNDEIDSILETLGEIDELGTDDSYLVRSGYFAGTIIRDKTIIRGASPLNFLEIRDHLYFQRVYLFDADDLFIIHEKIACRTTPTRRVEKMDSMSSFSFILNIAEKYSLLAANGKILTLVDQQSKMILPPKLASKIVGTLGGDSLLAEFEVSQKRWIYQRNKLALVADHDTIVSYIA
ncbi:MAG: RNA repair domain-containing protein [Candidatus Korarchaeota archaeon]|nr:RNA repair domain-containing protein [Thermoproteota archaeon]MCR8454769.1 RNA repair domain-containing protein [Thermoproteota archaeon]MCR8462661.1 RNA repair domain-containing protein [Thermoproteota archaeon]MCR8470280.1 RNA repair domain-containing protein [Thermoproteota archaeon]MCR8472079.1 RNA repair domain-containing protein [Thermoproteota archaeon]